MARVDRGDSEPMSNQGAEVKARRERLGMTIIDLAGEAGVSRDTLSDMESGRKNFTQLTLSKVLRALERIEAEVGIYVPPVPSTERDLVEIEVEGNRVVVRGPVANRDALAETVARLIRQMRAEGEEGRESPQP